MARKKITEQSKSDIKRLLKTKKLVMGTERVKKLARSAKLERIYISKNTPERVRNDLVYYSKLSNIKLIKLRYANDELGEICNKPFSISVLGVIKS